MLRNSDRTRLSPLVEICQLAEVLEHAIVKVLQAAGDHGRSRHRIHFRSIKRAVLSADYWDSARRGPRARTIAAVFRSHGEQSAAWRQKRNRSSKRRSDLRISVHPTNVDPPPVL